VVLCVCPSRCAAEGLEAALNTLSRALESNCEDPEVWSHYLSLFSRRGSRDELQQMCEMAVEHAPHYRVWWEVSTREAHWLFRGGSLCIGHAVCPPTNFSDGVSDVETV